MGAWKLLLAALATCLIAIGVAAQTGTVHVARSAHHAPAATTSPQPQVDLQAPQLQVAQPTQPAPAAPLPAAAPVQSGGDQGDEEGD
jgi:hypothetical protein